MTSGANEVGWSRRRRAVAVSLVFVAAAVLSAVTILALHWISAPAFRLPTSPPGIGFVRLDKPAPGVSLPSLRGGGTIYLRKLADKPIVINFWSSSCYPCRKETPALAAEARAVGSKVTFLGIDTADRRGAALAFIRRYRVPYLVAYDSKALAAGQYGIPGLPVTFFLSPSAKTIVGENVGALIPRILRELYGVT